MIGYYEPYWDQPDEELEHFGVKGMKWGVRRYQNADGTLTEAGKKRLSTYKAKEAKRTEKNIYTHTFFRDIAKRDSEKVGSIQSKRDLKHHEEMLRIYNKELAMIKKMSYSDMQEDRIAAGKARVVSLAAGGALSIGLGVATGTPLMTALIGPTALISAQTFAEERKTTKRNKRYDREQT